MSEFTVNVSDLLGHPGSRRQIVLDGLLDIDLDLASVSGPVHMEGRLDATIDEVVARGSLAFTATLRCNRCLTEWEQPMEVDFLDVFAHQPIDGDTIIERNGSLDLEQTFRDEVSLALPVVPLCGEDCLGLCPTCGTDLNTNPCSGHTDESASPFGALRHLLER